MQFYFTQDAYWHKRKHMRYYRVVQQILFGMSGSVLDVGGWETPMVLAGDFDRRLVVNLGPVKNRLKGVEYHIGDFMEWEIEPMDVVLCLQVLEHLDDQTVSPFTQRLFDVALHHVVISVPYKWRQDACRYHLQDPVDEADLRKWTGREPDHSVIVKDEKRRMICLYNV